MTYTEPQSVGKLFHKKIASNMSKTTSYLSDGELIDNNKHNKRSSDLFTQMDNFEFTMDIDAIHQSSPSVDLPNSPNTTGYRTDDTMTPPTTHTTNYNNPVISPYNSVKEFKLSFDEEDSQLISAENKIVGSMSKYWRPTFGAANCVGIGEWTLLSTPKVFDYYNKEENGYGNGNKYMNMSMHRPSGIGLGLGIGGFIDRTRGACGVSLAPIYYGYGGILSSEKYYDKLDAYNLYTGDYITCCNKLPFNNLHDTQCSIVRDGYKSTLVITGLCVCFFILFTFI